MWSKIKHVLALWFRETEYVGGTLKVKTEQPEYWKLENYILKYNEDKEVEECFDTETKLFCDSALSFELVKRWGTDLVCQFYYDEALDRYRPECNCEFGVEVPDIHRSHTYTIDDYNEEQDKYYIEFESNHWGYSEACYCVYDACSGDYIFQVILDRYHALGRRACLKCITCLDDLPKYIDTIDSKLVKKADELNTWKERTNLVEEICSLGGSNGNL